MTERRKIWGVSGDGHMIEKRFFGVWFYNRITTQKWSPVMHEYERERGVRIGHMRFGVTQTRRRFFDTEQPEIVNGAY